AENGENIKAVLDLSGEKAGKHTTQFKVNGLNKDVDYTVKPKETTVNLEEKVTKKLKVEPDVSDNDLDDNYKVSDQSVLTEKNTKKFKINDINKDVDYTVKPKETTVNLEEKVTKKLKVEPDVSDNDLDANYKVSDQSVSPETVKVTGGSKQIDKIAYLKAT